MSAVNRQGFQPINGDLVDARLILEDFISELLHVLGVARSESPKSFLMASACAGWCSYFFCSVLLGGHWVLELVGSFGAQVRRPHPGPAEDVEARHRDHRLRLEPESCSDQREQ